MNKIMNYLLAGFIGMLIFSACSDDTSNQDCYSCETVLLFPITQEFCDDGTNMTTVTTTVLGFSEDTVVGVSAMDYVNVLESTNYTCTMK